MARLLQSALFTVIFSAACLCCLTPALAYSANVGDRAANFKGFDIVNRQVVELDDYLGQWVFVEHWATW
jgi:hypothetical protein